MKYLCKRAATAVGLVLLASSECVNGDKAFECAKRDCVSGDAGSTLEVTCGGSGETLEILFASFGQPNGTCPDVNSDLFNSSALNLEIFQECHATNSLDKVKDLCQGKKECSLDVNGIFGSSDPGIGCASSEPLRLQVQANCVTSFDPFTIVLGLVIAMIGLALGASIEVHQFRRIMNEHKRAILIGFACQYGFMPLVAFTFVKIFRFNDLVSIGVILVGSAPGGTTSNLVTYYSKGAVALSITMSAASTICALFMLPLLVFVYINTLLDLDEAIAIPFKDIATTLVVAIGPAAIGVYIRHKNVQVAQKVEKFGSILGALFILAALVLGVLQNPDLVNPLDYPKSWSAAFLLQPIGGLLGYLVAGAAKLPRPERRAVCIETGLQNTTLVIAMVALTFQGCERVEILTFPLMASFALLVNSIWMAGLLRYSSKFDTDQDKAELAKDEAEMEAMKVQQASSNDIEK